MGDDFIEWKVHILSELQRISEEMKSHRDQHQELLLVLERMKTKSGLIWGSIGGILSAIAFAVAEKYL